MHVTRNGANLLRQNVIMKTMTIITTIRNDIYIHVYTYLPKSSELLNLLSTERGIVKLLYIMIPPTLDKVVSASPEEGRGDFSISSSSSPSCMYDVFVIPCL